MISYLLLLILLYIALNIPTLYFFPGSPTLYMLPFAYVYITLKQKWSVYLYCFRHELIVLSILCFYSFFLDFISNEDIYFQNVLYYIVDLFPLSFFLVLLCDDILSKNENEKNNISLLDLIIFISFISGIISLFLFLNPEINNFLKSTVLRTPDKVLFDPFLSAYRSFGFASGLLFNFPIMQGLIASLCILMFVRNRIYILFVPFIILSIFFNARIGFVPIVLCLILLLLRYKQYRLVYMYIALSILLFIMIAFYFELWDFFESTTEWVLTGVYAISDRFLNTNYSESFTTFDILDEMLVFPQNYIIGDQIYLFGISSDIGYILQLNYGGFVLILMFLLFWIVLFSDLYKCSDSSFENRVFILIIIITVILSNYKGDFLEPSCAQRFIILFYVWKRMKKRKTYIECTK